MKELSLYILDITMNSVRAGASEIGIDLEEISNILTVRISDNGCGMTKEQVQRLSDPFFTTRTTRKVGLGVPFFRMIAEMTDGSVTITSVPESESDDHGTEVKAIFHTDHIDFVPLGDIVETLITLIQGSPDVNFVFTHKKDAGEVRLSIAEIKEVLGEDVPVSSFEILSWIRGYLTEQYDALNESV